jgi:predicted aspartyl protease
MFIQMRLGRWAIVATAIAMGFVATPRTTAQNAPQSAATAPAAPAEPGKVSLVGKLPAELKVKRAKTGHLLVQAQIDGKDAGWFIFDTGAGMSCLDKKIVQRLALPDAGEASAQGSGGAQATHLRAVKSLAVGPVLVEDSTVVELDLRPIAAAMGEQIDGVVGYECFLAGIFEVNLEEAKITVHDPGTYKLPEGQRWHSLSFLGRRPCVPGKIEDREEGRFLIDLGANSAITIHAPAVEKLKLLEGRETKASMTGGVGGMHAARSGSLKELTICGQTIREVPAIFATTSKAGPSESELQATIGVGVLKRFQCVVNYRDKSIALLPRG